MPIYAKRHIIADIDRSPPCPSSKTGPKLEVNGRAINSDVAREGASVNAESLDDSPLDHRKWRDVYKASIEKRKVRGNTRSANDPVFNLLRAERSSGITAPQSVMKGANHALTALAQISVGETCLPTP
jgi:hypothetical protein